MMFYYILLEYKGEVGYLVYKDSSKLRTENVYQNMASIICENLCNKIDNKTTISQFNQILKYKIFPVDSYLNPLNPFVNSTVYFPISDFYLIKIESEKEIEDFSKLNRDEPSIDSCVMKIIDNNGNIEETGFDIYLN